MAYDCECTPLPRDNYKRGMFAHAGPKGGQTSKSATDPLKSELDIQETLFNLVDTGILCLQRESD